jgi:hypothetical protein
MIRVGCQLQSYGNLKCRKCANETSGYNIYKVGNTPEFEFEEGGRHNQLQSKLEKS